MDSYRKALIKQWRKRWKQSGSKQPFKVWLAHQRRLYLDNPDKYPRLPSWLVE